MQKLNVHELRKKPAKIDFSVAADIFSALDEMQKSGECEFIEPVSFSVVAEPEFDHIRVDGEYSTLVRLSCARCLERFDLPVKENFRIYYQEAQNDGVIADSEIELAEVDLLSAVYSGDEIDISPEIVDLLITEIPYKPLCRENCKGLCPVCGTDLNLNSCKCDKKSGSPAFQTLASFKVQNKGE